MKKRNNCPDGQCLHLQAPRPVLCHFQADGLNENPDLCGIHFVCRYMTEDPPIQQKILKTVSNFSKRNARLHLSFLVSWVSGNISLDSPNKTATVKLKTDSKSNNAAQWLVPKLSQKSKNFLLLHIAMELIFFWHYRFRNVIEKKWGGAQRK